MVLDKIIIGDLSNGGYILAGAIITCIVVHVLYFFLGEQKLRKLGLFVSILAFIFAFIKVTYDLAYNNIPIFADNTIIILLLSFQVILLIIFHGYEAPTPQN